MSIIQGKKYDWGSRSGKNNSKSKDNLSIVDKLIHHGFSSEILDYISSNEESFLSEIQDIVKRRSHIKDEAKKVSLKRVYNTKKGTLYNGDCIRLMQEKIEDNSIDCIFADPPFNLAKMYGHRINDQMNEVDYLEWSQVWIDLCCEKLKEGGSFFIYNIPKWSTYIAHFLNQKLTFKNWIAIDLTLSMPIPNKLYPSHYSLLYFIKGKRSNHFSPPRLSLKTCIRCGREQNDYGGYKKKMNPSGVNLRDIWLDINPVRHAKNKNRDANELSVKLLDRVLDIATKEGDLVFDPFGGSGTTYAVAELTKRKWIGVELGDCSPIIDRVKNVKNERDLLEKYRTNINTLFTDQDLINRKKSGLPLNNYNITKEQISRVIS